MLIRKEEIDKNYGKSDRTNRGLYSYDDKESNVQQEYANYGDDPDWQFCKELYFLGMGSNDEYQRFYDLWKFGI